MTDGRPPGPDDALTEDRLRERLHRAVATVEPGPGALPRLRAAVPRRRAVRRRALGGAVVLAAAIAALPVVDATQPFSLSGDSTGGQAAPGPGSSPAKTPGTHPGHPHTAAALPTAGPTGTGPETLPNPSADPDPAVPPAAAPACARTDLGRADVQQAAADPADGKVYGWFRLTNTGPHPCRVPGPGALALGSGAGGVRLLAHTAGDPAGSLPDPAALPADVRLDAGGSYLVRFAWVPAGCATASGTPTGPAGPPPATPAASGAALPAGTGADPAAAAGPTPGPTRAAVGADPSPTADPTGGATAAPPPAAAFTLGYTPDPAAAAGPPIGTTLPAGCGGTVYWTGPEPVPAPAPGASPSATP
ncbi:hypothetical protein AB0O31_27285 [Kitasatospora cineracea]|uniref:hypothetical protein n=1 Tax=Kitasatospora cineracea TaxID=88074 RepID=UPI0034456655